MFLLGQNEESAQPPKLCNFHRVGVKGAIVTSLTTLEMKCMIL